MEAANKKVNKKKKFSFGAFFQELGKTFMLPVALMAFMGVILGIGSALSGPTAIERIPFLGNPVLQLIFGFMSSVGGFAFNNMAPMFALAIPLGIAKAEKGVAAFSGFVGYMVMNLSINYSLTIRHQLASTANMQHAGQASMLGVQTLDMGVLGGILVGIIVYNLHERYHDVQLPDSFAFFSGARFVPIITSLVMAVVGLILPYIWPFFAFLIQGLGTLIRDAGPFGPFLFFSGERLLLPFGLHHILVATIRFTQAGGTAVVNGHTIYGALNIFYAQLQHHLPISHNAVMFLSQGKMPTFMFGLPGAALAMYQTARPENRAKVKGLLISGVIATFVSGITEPIEFLFLFISPFLWIFHVIMTGFGAMVVSLLGVSIGNTDGDIIDFVVFGVMQGNQTKWFLVPLVGIIWFFAYYFTFKKYILWKNLRTPGREIVEAAAGGETAGPVSNSSAKSSGFNVKEILAALGGTENIVSLDNCITRLRMVMKDGTKVDDDKLKALGALGVMHLDDTSVQVVIGTKVVAVRNELDKLIADPDNYAVQVSSEKVAGPTVTAKRGQTIKLLSIVTGLVRPLSEVPDQVFSTGMVGQGCAIEPTDSKVFAPVDGTISTVFPTKHAIGIQDENGLEILIHLGLDTVGLAGKPFNMMIAEGDQVKVGDLLVSVDWQAIKDAGLSTVSPIVLTNSAEFNKIEVLATGEVKAGVEILSVER